jgi:cytochrome oxidase assembly protein ShyY1
VYRFLLSRRWLGFAALTLVLCVAFVLASQWQLNRNEQRQALNAVVESNVDRPPVPVGELLRPREPGELSVGRSSVAGSSVAEMEWRAVTATGTYDTDHELLVRNRQLSGAGVGYEVLTPLVTADGTGLVVNRGWVPAGATAATRPDVPPPPAGVVTVTGRVRPSDTTPPDRADPPAGQLIAADVDRMAQQLPYPVYGAWVQAMTEEPAPAAAPARLPVAEVTAGPHLSYAVQWILFVGVAVVGYVVLIRREAEDRRGGHDRSDSDRSDSDRSDDDRTEPAWQG